MPKPSEIYNKFSKDKDKDVALPSNPVFIPGMENENADLDELKALGWERPNFTTATRMMPTPGFVSL